MQEQSGAFAYASNFVLHQPQFTHIQNATINESFQVCRQRLQQELKPVQGAHLNTDKTCLMNTRVGVIAEISDWINSTGNDVCRTFFLCGEAGTGKSAISHTIGERSRDMQYLGAFFSFDRAYAIVRTPSKALQTIAYELGVSVPRFGDALLKNLDRDPHILNTMSITEQWKSLIVDPARNSGNPFTRVVIVIDALDECAAQEENGPREKLLSVLIERGDELPSNFRLLVTSRMERDVLAYLSEGTSIKVRYMSSLADTRSDIAKYVVHRMMKSKGGRDVLDEVQCKTLGEKAEGFFQWANTVCEALRGKGKGGLSVSKRFIRFMAQAPSGSKDLLPLDKLYKSILEEVFDETDDEVMDEYRKVMAQILSAYEPLSQASWMSLRMAFFHETGEDFDMDAVIPFLGSLLTGLENMNTAVRPVHTSIRDFLLDPDRSGSFAIQIKHGHEILSAGTLQLMISELHFNMCDLESSHIPNSQVKGMPDKLANIPPVLVYACCFWDSHLVKLSPRRTQLKLLQIFLHKSCLFYLEVLSILNKVHLGSMSMLSIRDWLNDAKTSTETILEIHRITTDVHRFVRVFGKAITECTPQLYLSGLPFTPRDSILQKIYTSNFRKLPVLCHGHKAEWPSQQAVLKEHKAVVCSVAFSSDGRRIVSGSADSSLVIWDAETGAVVDEPLQGHRSWVRSVGFSPDGTKIVSGSEDCSVRIWNVKTGNPIHCLKGHTGTVMSVTFSPDGQKIASGATDSSVRIWDAETGDAIGMALQGHTDTVWSVAFSPDGKQIASGSADWSVWVWDAATGAAIQSPLQRHEWDVVSVAFSEDGNKIISCSGDNSVRIWNAETGATVTNNLNGISTFATSFSSDAQRLLSGSTDRVVRIWDVDTGDAIGRPLQGHTQTVWSVAFSPDGKRIVSGSADWTVRIWDAETGTTIRNPQQEHTGNILTVAFSPDGKKIVSGSGDRLQVWDSESGAAITKPLQGHTGTVWSAAFSPDGNWIVSGSDDKSVQIWNAETGESTRVFLHGHTSGVKSVMFSSDGKRIISESHDNSVRMWDIETGGVIGEPHQGPINYSRAVAFSEDGTRIVSGSDRLVCIWDAVTGAPIGPPLQGHTDEVTSVAFSADGKRIVSAADDGTVRVWSAETVAEPLGSQIYDVQAAVLSTADQEITSIQTDASSKNNSSKISFCSQHTNHFFETSYKPFQELHLNPDGWICGSDLSLLLWVPPEYRVPLTWSRMQVMISREGQACLNLSNFVHGTDWAKCYTGSV